MIAGLEVLAAKQISDDRGTVREVFRASNLPLARPWAQINLTYTKQGAVRGLHGENITKLVGVVSGEAFGVYLDARVDSPTHGEVTTLPLTVGTHVLVPAGVCNGFQAISPGGCEYLYCFDTEWAPDLPGVAVTPLDPALGIDWPIAIDVDNRAQISAKDVAAPRFAGAGG
jgi:dTDP-4-dehydrorhamnose 3,5-epimerase